MIKAVIFDCFGVLTVDLWKEFLATLPDEQRQQASYINRAYDRGDVGKAEFLQQIQSLTGKSPSQVEDIRNSDGTKNKELLAYIGSLKPKYKIGLLSNIATNWIREELLTEPEQLLFDQMILSFEVKMTKPDPQIFHLAAERLGVDTRECVLVDDINRYCEAAKQEGMQAVLYQNFDQMKPELEALLAKA